MYRMILVAAVALIAGLFLGYLTLDALDLRILQRASLHPEERVWAATILPIVVERHRVLVTLLLLNGLGVEEVVQRLLPQHEVVRLVVALGGTFSKPGTVEYWDGPSLKGGIGTGLEAPDSETGQGVAELFAETSVTVSGRAWPRAAPSRIERSPISR